MDYVEPPSLKLEVYYEKYSEDVYECECCGSCFPEGERVYFNGKEIWEKYYDGHMYGRQSGELLDALINGLLTEIKKQKLGDYFESYFKEYCVDPIREIMKIADSVMTGEGYMELFCVCAMHVICHGAEVTLKIDTD
jgi:hypothetical protein